MTKLIATAEMTTGPFFPRRYVDAGANDLTQLDGRPARGETIELHGRVVQEDGTPMDNLILEIWQADANGIFRDAADPRAADADPNFYGWGRAATSAQGEYRFRTVKPGAYAMPDGVLRAPHINMVIVFSGLMRMLQTTVFFEGEGGNATDPVLTAVLPIALRERLIARRDGAARFRFDIRLRGDGETPFFDD
jgi:protocatechuate 3,4-dioxygenase alpha subunit